VRRAAFPLLLFLAGFLLGALCLFSLDDSDPAALMAAPDTSSSQTGESDFSSDDTTALLTAAAQAAEALRDRDYESLAELVHPERGVTFSLYSTVDLAADQNFSAGEIRDLEENTNKYLWGYEDGRGEPIRLTISDFLDQYVFSVDYTKAPQVGVDEIVLTGNSLENLTEIYTDCRFVDLCYPGFDPEISGLDWCSLKLVFAPGESGWLLVGIIHSQWTI